MGLSICRSIIEATADAVGDPVRTARCSLSVYDPAT